MVCVWSVAGVVLIASAAEALKTDVPSVETFVKLFDATLPAAAFCENPPPYELGTAGTDDLAFYNGAPPLGMGKVAMVAVAAQAFNAILKLADVAQNVTEAELLAITYDPDAFFPKDTHASVAREKLLNKRREAMDALSTAELSAQLTSTLERLRLIKENKNGEQAALAERLRSQLIGDTSSQLTTKTNLEGRRRQLASTMRLGDFVRESAARRTLSMNPKARGDFVSLDNTDDLDVDPTSFLGLVGTEVLAYAVGCLAGESENSGLIPTKTTVRTNMVNIGECECKGVQAGTDRGDAHGDGCGMLNILEEWVTCSQNGGNCTDVDQETLVPSGFDICDAPKIPPESTSTDPNVDYDLWLKEKPTGVVLPEILDGSYAATEGLTYYFLYRACRTVAKFSRQALCGNEKIVDVVPGWKTELVINSIQEGDDVVDSSGRGSVPIAVVSSRNCETLLTIRSTETKFEWRMNFTYNQILAGAEQAYGAHHHGFSSVAASIVPTFLSLHHDIMNRAECQGVANPRIIINGHSLGGGIGTVAANFISTVLPDAKIDVVLFSAPNVLTPAGADSFNERLNARSIQHELDAIPRIPCNSDDSPGGLLLCPRGNIKNGPGTETVIYHHINGRVMLSADSLETLSGDAAWSSDLMAIIDINVLSLSVDVAALDGAPYQLDANHVCSYSCFTGQFCRDPTTSRWSCSSTSTNGDVIEPCQLNEIAFTVAL